MAPIVLFDLHCQSPCNRIRALDIKSARNAGHPARLLERLLSRGTDALTNFFANGGVVLRRLPKPILFLPRQAPVRHNLLPCADGPASNTPPLPRGPPPPLPLL